MHKKYVFLKNSEIFHARKEIINNDTKELEEIVFPSYTIIVQKEESYATSLKKDYQTLKQSIEDQCIMCTKSTNLSPTYRMKRTK